MGELILHGLEGSLQPLTFGLIVGGVIIGITFASIPGLSGAAAMAMLLPVSYGLPAVPAVLLLIAIWNAAVWAGAVPAITMGIPGTAAAAATMIDGHPLAQQGFARKAIRTSIIGAFIGSMAAGLALLLIAPALANVVLYLGPFEIFAFASFGVTLVVSITRGSLRNSLISVAIGLFLGTVGYSPSGFPRFVFTPDLLSGIPQIPALIGLFTFPQLISVMRQRRASVVSTPVSTNKDTFLRTWRDWGEHWFNFVRSAVVGVFMGIHPGAGPTIASFITYNEAKRAGKKATPPYGEGNIGGVIASDTGANAAVLSGLIPAFTLGIPGSVDTVIIIAALTLHGLTPGPTLFEHHAPFVYTIFVGALVANVVMLVVGLQTSRWTARLATLPTRYLVAIVTVMGLVGAFAVEGSWVDVVICLALGLGGYALRVLGISIVPLLLGLILGPILESNLYEAIGAYGSVWQAIAMRPVADIFLLLSLASLAHGIYSRRRRIGSVGTDVV